MAYFRTLLLLVVSAEAARVAPVQKKLEKAENTTKPAKVDEKTLEKEKALEKKDETLKMCMSKMFDMLQHPDQQKNAAKCEKDGKFVDQVIGDIQKDDEAAAKAQVNQLFTKCASLPTDCAAEVAPQLIEMLRLSGAAVSKKCRDEIQKPQEDEKLMTEASNCDSKMNISESTLSALNAGTLRLKREEQIVRILVLNDPRLLCGLAHEKFVFFAPEGGHGEDPAHFRLHDFADLLGQLLYGFGCDVLQTLCYDFHERELAPI
jgi:hypothetical protein